MAAVKATGRLFGPMQPDVVLIAVNEPTSAIVVDPLGLVGQGTEVREHGVASQSAAEDALERAAFEIPEATQLIVEGDPVESICRAAELESADLVVVGVEDKGILLRLIDPSVSTGVLRRTRRPVLVVHEHELT